MTLTDILIVLTIMAGGTLIAGTIIHLISGEIEYRRWQRVTKDDHNNVIISYRQIKHLVLK